MASSLKEIIRCPKDVTLDKVLRSPQGKDVMHGSILLVTMSPGHTPVFSPHPGTQKETISHPRAPDRPHIRFLLHLFDPYKSETTRFKNFYKRFPEFIERRIMDVMM